MSSSQKALWEELKAGNRSAFHQIYQEHVDFLYNYGKKFSLDAQTVEDCIHDLFVTIWMKREKLGQTDNIRGYLALSLRRDILRVSRRSMLTEDVSERSVFSAVASIEDWITANELAEERSSKLKSAYESLTQKQREIIFMRYHQNMEYEQIANVLGVKYQSLRNLLSAAMKGLRASMATACFLSLFLISCSTEEEAYVDPEFQIYFDAFIEEAIKRNYPITDRFLSISAELGTIEDASGQCLTSSSGVRVIRVDSDYWSRIGSIRKEFLIFHELGHCYLDLSHDDTADPTGTCISIMSSGLGGCNHNYSARTRDQYLDQLFAL